jgi:transposase
LIEEAIERHIAGDGELDRLAKVLRAVRGVGPVVAATLIADLPELGRLSGNREPPSSASPPHPRKRKRIRQAKSNTGLRPNEAV